MRPFFTIYLAREEKRDFASCKIIETQTMLSFIEISKYPFSFAQCCDGNATIV